jgi:predicted phage gp36 major capsid-like protein
MPERLLGYPTAVTSAMDLSVTTAAENYVLSLVDMNSFVIVQRVGTRIELVSHLGLMHVLVTGVWVRPPFGRRRVS